MSAERCVTHHHACPCREVAHEAERVRLRAPLEWLVSLDDPDPSCRRRVTLRDIIVRARAALTVEADRG